MKVEIKVPAVGESITEATIAEWSKKNGESVKRDDILLVLETDKASVEVVAESDGVLTTTANEGDTVAIGAVIGHIDSDGVASVTSQTSTQTSTPPQIENSPTSNSQTSVTQSKPHPALSPAVSKMVKENNLNPESLGAGSGKDGRLTKGDVLNSLNSTPAAAVSNPPPSNNPNPTPGFLSKQTSGTRESRRVGMSKLRQTIAKRLVQAQQTAAILTTFNEIDMTAVMALRSKYKDSFKEKYGIGLGFMGFFVKATVEALKQYNQVNAEIDGDSFIFKDFINMGIAVSTEKGLLVPVLKDADLMSIAEIELAIRHYAQKARDGKISLDDLAGGTFTISNGGVFGSLMSTPILNPPQSGILGLHKIEDRPMAINGEVKIRPMMYVALSYDHRIIDGRESVSFLVKIKECMEDPARMLLEI